MAGFRDYLQTRKDNEIKQSFIIIKTVITMLAFFVTGILNLGQTGELRTRSCNEGNHHYIYPEKLGGRYLLDQDDRPFFWSGETVWPLIARLNKQETH